MDTTLIVGISLIALTVAVIGLLCGLLYFLFRETRRVSDLEVEFRTFREMTFRRIRESLAHPETSDDPPNEARRDELLRKLEANTIARHEAIELSDILAEEEKRARDRGDTAILAAIGLGLALLAAFLATRR